MSLKDHKRDWENLGELDPYWAVLSDPSKRFGGWKREEFFETGRAEIAQVLEQAAAHGLPEGKAAALDFGCGLGRLTRAMAGHFDRCEGVDISASMIEQAKALHDEEPRCHFQVNDRPDLTVFEDGIFDFVYSNIVLQHNPDRGVIRSYIREFVRILRPGGIAVFQLPTAVSFRQRLNPRRRAYTFLRAVGVPERTLYEKLKLSPITMNFLPEEAVRSEIDSAGGRLLEARADSGAGPGNESRLYFATR